MRFFHLLFGLVLALELGCHTGEGPRVRAAMLVAGTVRAAGTDLVEPQPLDRARVEIILPEGYYRDREERTHYEFTGFDGIYFLGVLFHASTEAPFNIQVRFSKPGYTPVTRTLRWSSEYFGAVDSIKWRNVDVVLHKE